MDHTDEGKVTGVPVDRRSLWEAGQAGLLVVESGGISTDTLYSKGNHAIHLAYRLQYGLILDNPARSFKR